MDIAPSQGGQYGALRLAVVALHLTHHALAAVAGKAAEDFVGLRIRERGRVLERDNQRAEQRAKQRAE